MPNFDEWLAADAASASSLSPDTIAGIATSSNGAADAATNAQATAAFQQASQEAQQLQMQNPADQTKAWKSMNDADHQALLSAGYKPIPGVTQSRGLMGWIKGDVLAPIGRDVIGTPTRWFGEATSHLPSPVRGVVQGAVAAPFTGVTDVGLITGEPEKQLLNVYRAVEMARDASGDPTVAGYGGIATPPGFLRFGKELVDVPDWAKYYSSTRNGESTFLPSEVKRIEGSGQFDQSTLDTAKLLASGPDPYTAAKKIPNDLNNKNSDGLTEQAAALQRFQSDPEMQQAVTMFQNAKISPGRLLLGSDFLDKHPEAGAWLSGGFDAIFQFATDPTSIALGAYKDWSAARYVANTPAAMETAYQTQGAVRSAYTQVARAAASGSTTDIIRRYPVLKPVAPQLVAEHVDTPDKVNEFMKGYAGQVSFLQGRAPISGTEPASMVVLHPAFHNRLQDVAQAPLASFAADHPGTVTGKVADALDHPIDFLANARERVGAGTAGMATETAGTSMRGPSLSPFPSYVGRPYLNAALHPLATGESSVGHVAQSLLTLDATRAGKILVNSQNAVQQVHDVAMITLPKARADELANIFAAADNTDLKKQIVKAIVDETGQAGGANLTPETAERWRTVMAKVNDPAGHRFSFGNNDVMLNGDQETRVPLLRNDLQDEVYLPSMNEFLMGSRKASVTRSVMGSAPMQMLDHVMPTWKLLSIFPNLGLGLRLVMNEGLTVGLTTGIANMAKARLAASTLNPDNPLTRFVDLVTRHLPNSTIANIHTPADLTAELMADKTQRAFAGNPDALSLEEYRYAAQVAGRQGYTDSILPDGISAMHGNGGLMDDQGPATRQVMMHGKVRTMELRNGGADRGTINPTEDLYHLFFGARLDDIARDPYGIVALTNQGQAPADRVAQLADVMEKDPYWQANSKRSLKLPDGKIVIDPKTEMVPERTETVPGTTETIPGKTETTPISADQIPFAPYYHGTSQRLPEDQFSSDRYGVGSGAGNFVGPGIYLTNDRGVATSYTFKGKGNAPAVHGVRWVGAKPPNLIDLEQPLPQDVALAFAAHVQNNMSLLAEAPAEEADKLVAMFGADSQASGMDVYKQLRKVYSDAGLPKGEVDDALGDLHEVLEQAGYDGFSYQGGAYRGGGKNLHDATVIFDPQNLAVTHTATPTTTTGPPLTRVTAPTTRVIPGFQRTVNSAPTTGFMLPGMNDATLHEAAVDAATRIINHVDNLTHIPFDPAGRDIDTAVAANGLLRTGDPLQVGNETMAQYLLRTGRSPSPVALKELDDENLPLGINGQGLTAVAPNPIRNITRNGLNVIVGRPLNEIIRKPAYLHHFAVGLRQNYSAGGLVSQLAERFGADSPGIEKMAADSAAEYAVAKLQPMIHDPEVRSQFATIAHNIFPFFYAQEQAYKRLARATIVNPKGMRQLMMLNQGLAHSGLVHTDPQTGKSYFVYPGSAMLDGAVNDTLQKLGIDVKLPISGALEGNPDWISPVRGSPMPSFGPLAGIPVDAGVNLFPELAPVHQALMPNSSTNFLAAMMPSSVYRVLSAADPSVFSAPSYQSALLATLQSAEASGAGLPPSATAGQINTFKNRAVNFTRIRIIMRALTSMTGPSAASFERDAMDTKLQQLMVNLGPEQALAVWQKEYPDATPFTTYGSRSIIGGSLPETQASLDWIDKNKSLVSQFPYAASLLMPHQAGTFNQAAYDEQLATGMRIKKTPEQFMEDMLYASAAKDYFEWDDKKNAALNSATSSQAKANIRASWTAWSSTYLAQNPVFAKILNGGPDGLPPASVTAQQSQLELTTLMAQPRFANDPQYDSLRTLSNLWDQYTASKNSLVGTSASVTAQRKVLGEGFAQLAVNYVQGNPEVQDFFLRVIRPQITTELNNLSAADNTTTSALLGLGG